jgi:protein ImuB
LKWCHDAVRAKTTGNGGELTIRIAAPSRNSEHLSRLLAERLAKIELLAPVGDLELVADEVRVQEETSHSLLPDAREDGESLALVLERIAAWLGPSRVLRPVGAKDHRPEWMCHWQPAPESHPQQPETAKGVIFVSLGDETGTSLRGSASRKPSAMSC